MDFIGVRSIKVLRSKQSIEIEKSSNLEKILKEMNHMKEKGFISLESNEFTVDLDIFCCPLASYIVLVCKADINVKVTDNTAIFIKCNFTQFYSKSNFKIIHSNMAKLDWSLHTHIIRGVNLTLGWA